MFKNVVKFILAIPIAIVLILATIPIIAITGIILLIPLLIIVGVLLCIAPIFLYYRYLVVNDRKFRKIFQCKFLTFSYRFENGKTPFEIKYPPGIETTQGVQFRPTDEFHVSPGELKSLFHSILCHQALKENYTKIFGGDIEDILTRKTPSRNKELFLELKEKILQRLVFRDREYLL